MDCYWRREYVEVFFSWLYFSSVNQRAPVTQTVTLKRTAAALAVQIQMFLTSLQKLSVKKHTLIVSMKNYGTTIQDRYGERKKYCVSESRSPLYTINSALFSNMLSDLFQYAFFNLLSPFLFHLLQSTSLLISRVWWQLMNPGDYSAGIISDSVNKTWIANNVLRLSS